MALITCPYCEHYPVYELADVCPKCGGPIKNRSEVDNIRQNQALPVRPDGPIRVVDIDLQFQLATIDSHAQTVVVKAKARIGLADGSIRPGIVVSFHINEKTSVDVETDSDGFATLDTGLLPRYFETGENEIVVRVQNSAKTARCTFELLTNSSISRIRMFAVDSKTRQPQFHDDHCERPRLEHFSATIYLSSLDFADNRRVKIFVAIERDGGQLTYTELTTDSSGYAHCKIENNFTAYEYFDRDFVGTSDYLELDTATDVLVSLWGSGFQPSSLEFRSEC